MDLAGIFHADSRTIVRMVERGLVWWRDELLAMVPQRWRRISSGGTWTVVRPDGDGFCVERPEGPCPLDPSEAVLDGRVMLCLPRNAGLLRRLDLPPLPASDLRRMIALDIDRLTPFEAGDVFFDVAIEERTAAGRRVTVGILPRDRAKADLERLRERGVFPKSLSLADDEGRPCFDFLPAMREEKGRRRGWTASRMWGLAAALLLFNLALFTVQDVMSLAALRQRIEEQRPVVHVAEKLRASIEAESARRRDLLRRKHLSSPLPVLDSLTRALPDQVWIQRLEWNGVTLRISGWSQGEVDALALVEAAPLLRDARPMASAIAPRPPYKPFEITVQRQTEGTS